MMASIALGKLFRAPFRYRPWRGPHLRLIVEDAKGCARRPERGHEVHLRAAIEWLCRAQDAREECSDAGGVSAGWSFEDGWLPSYPETSGYIVETFIAASRVLERADLLRRAHRIIDWELSIQAEDGAFPGHFGEPGSRPVIFNTGQIMHGMVAGFVELGRAECLDAALRAGRWLAAHQDPDGCWRRAVHNGVPHTYNTRAAWAMLRTARLAGEPGLERAALRNVEWALTRQTPCGWFESNAFTPGRAPFTHTIAYAVRGILEIGVLRRDESLLAAAAKAASALAQRQRADGWLAGAYADGWAPRGSYCCLTGLAQVTIIWERLAGQRLGSGWPESVRRALGYLKRCQSLEPEPETCAGGMAGSAPIWGGYSRFEYPNWAAKFFADALMMDMSSIPIPAEKQACRDAAVRSVG